MLRFFAARPAQIPRGNRTSRLLAIATISAAVNVVGWGAFGRLLATGTGHKPPDPVVLTLAPAQLTAPLAPRPPEPAVTPVPDHPRVATPEERQALPTEERQMSHTQRLLKPAPRPLAPQAPSEPLPARTQPSGEEPSPPSTKSSVDLPPPPSASLPADAIAALPPTPSGTLAPAHSEAVGSHAGPRDPSAASTGQAGTKPPASAGLANWDRGALSRRIHGAIARHRHYPSIARRRGLEGTVLLSFRVSSQGAVEEVQVLESAGTLLDRAAMQALRRAAPLPFYPEPIRVPVVFRLEN